MSHFIHKDFTAIVNKVAKTFGGPQVSASDIQDIESDVQIRWMEHPYDASKAKGKISSYLWLLAKHATIDFLRARRGVPVEISESQEEGTVQVEDRGLDPLGALLEKERFAVLAAAMDQLSPEDRDILEHFSRDDFDPYEYACDHEISAPTVYVRKHRAIHKLRKILGIE